MEYRIRESERGFYAEIGSSHKGGAEIPGKLGYTMPGFIVYEMSRFDTREQAQEYLDNKKKGIFHG